MSIPANFTTAVNNSRQRAIWYVEIEGLRRRYSDKIPAWAPAEGGGSPAGTARDLKAYLAQIPSVSAQRAKPLNGTCEPHSFDVELVDVDEEFTDLFAVNDTTSRVDVELTADIGSSTAATTLQVDDSGLFDLPCDLYVERETMRATAAPTGTTLTVVRGMYGSEAVKHSIADADGNAKQVVVSDKPRFIVSREISLCESRIGLLEADAIRLRGVIESISEKRAVWKIEARGQLGRMDQQIGLDAPKTFLSRHLRGLNETADELASLQGAPKIDGYPAATFWCAFCDDVSAFPPAGGSVMIGNEIVRFESTDAGPPNLLVIDQDFADLEVDRWYWNATIGKGRGLLYFDIYGEPLMSGAMQVVGGSEDAVRFARSNLFIRTHEPGEEVRQVLTYQDFTAGTDPIAIVLQILLSKEGDGANHATWDTLPKGWGLGLQTSVVDVDGMEELRGQVGSQSWDMHFAITKPTAAKRWIEENVLRPALLFFREQWDGTIGLARVYTKAEAEIAGADLEISEGSRAGLLEIPDYDAGSAPMGKIEIGCNYYPPTDEYLGKLICKFGDSDDIYKGQADSFEIQIQTLYDPKLKISGSAWTRLDQGDLPEFAAAYLQPITERFAFNPPPRLGAQLLYSQMTKVPVGALVTVTSSATPNPKTRRRGLAGEWFQVVECKPNPSKGRVELTLWMVDIHDHDYRRIAPSAEVKTWTAGTKTIEIEPNIYAPSGDGEVNYFSALDKIRIMTSEYVERTIGETMTIASIGDDTIVLTGTPTDAPVAGDIVDTAPWDSSAGAQQGAWAYMAGSDGTLGAGEDDGHERL